METVSTQSKAKATAASAYTLLVIEDAELFQTAIRMVLEHEGYAVSVTESGEKGLQLLDNVEPDLVVLDVGLPGIDGMEVCQKIRSMSDANIVMLTGRSDDESRFAGLELGADAYITKPFEPRELLVTIRVLLRRRVPNQQRSNVATAGPVQLDRNTRRVRIGDVEFGATKIEMAMLDVLIENQRQVVSRVQLTEAVWGANWVGDDHVISVHIANLRKKIPAEYQNLLATVRGVGYRLDTSAFDDD